MQAYTIRNIDDFVAASRSKASWVQIAPPIERPVKSPAFILGEWPAELSFAFYNETKVGPVRCYRLRDVTLTIDGIILSSPYALSTALVNHPDYHVNAILQRLSAREEPLTIRHVEGQIVMLSGPGSHIYGHWLIDILPRLFVLLSCGYDLGMLRYAVPARLPAFCCIYLKLLGINNDQLVFYDQNVELLEVEELILPTNLRYGSQIHPLMVEFFSLLRRQIADDLTSPFPGRGRRLFISRQGGEPSRTLQNRERIESIAIEAGYDVISPETLTVQDQMALFSSATEIVGEYGSGLHGSVFAPPGAVVLALRGSSHHPGFIQSGLGQVFRQPTGYVLAPTSITAVDQIFTVSEESFRLGTRCSALLAAQIRDLG